MLPRQAQCYADYLQNDVVPHHVEGDGGGEHGQRRVHDAPALEPDLVQRADAAVPEVDDQARSDHTHRGGVERVAHP